MTPVATAEFSALMAPLGPFGRRPALAVAVSGGADSMALCLLAVAWARARGGTAGALIVDHGLRAESAAEADLTRTRLAARGIVARVLTLALARGPALAARARTARYDALEAACAADGVVHLLLGHHAADQAETVEMRKMSGSGTDGLAAMPALAERGDVRLLRPLVALPPGRLRATLQAMGECWVEDPSNRDPAALRTRLRAARNDPDGAGPATAEAVARAGARGRARALRERATAAILARRARIAPEGFAVVTPGALPPDALAALLRTVSGADWAPAGEAVRALAVHPRPATLGGVRILPAGRFGPRGLLLVREAAAVASPRPLAASGKWDRRFRLTGAPGAAETSEIGALADDAAALRGTSDLPAAALHPLPGIRLRGKLVAAPHVGYGAEWCGSAARAVFVPAVPLAGGPFLAAVVQPG
jgi:tRNA(Ile)-lysidine synthase